MYLLKTTIVMEDNSVIHIATEYQDVIFELTRDDNESKFYKIDDCLTINKDKILMIQRHFNVTPPGESKHFLEEGIYRP